MNRRFILLILVFAAALIYFGYIVPVKRGVQVGDEAPVFAVPNYAGKMVRLSDFRGETVLLNFWATWCPPCVWEMPSLERLHQTLQDNKFHVLAISLDEGGWAPVQEFRKAVTVSFPILLDIRTEAASLYETYQLPESYLIGPEGTVLKKYIGPKKWDDDSTIAEIRKLMAEYGESRGES